MIQNREVFTCSEKINNMIFLPWGLVVVLATFECPLISLIVLINDGTNVLDAVLMSILVGIAAFMLTAVICLPMVYFTKMNFRFYFNDI